MSYHHFKDLPVYRQAISLRTMSRAIASYVSYNKDLVSLRHSQSHRDQLADSLLQDAILIPKQIAQAESSASRATRLRSVKFISIITRNLNAYCKGLEMDGIREREYLDLLRSEVKTFRMAFKKWRKGLLL